MLSIALVMGIVAAGCGGDSGEGSPDDQGTSPGETQAEALEPVSIVFGTAGEREFDNMPFLIAEEEGYYEEEGVDVEIVHFSGGGGELVSGFASGQVDFGFTSFASALRGVLADVPIKIVAETSTFPVFWGLIVPPDSSIQSADDLEPGDRIAITSEGGLTHYVALLILGEAGLDPSEVELVPLGVGPEMPAALRAGEIDAAIAFPPNGPLLEAEGAARYVVSLNEFLPAFTFAGVVASEDALADEDKKAAFTRLFKAYQRALQWMEDNPEDAVAFIQEKYEMEADLAQQMYDAGMENFNRTGEVNRDGLEYVLSTSAEHGFLEEEISLEEAADFSLTPVD